MKVGYGKLGRSLTLSPERDGFQGDAEARNLLIRLAQRNPSVEWVLLGRHTTITCELPPNVTDPWGDERFTLDLERRVTEKCSDLDGAVIQIGQHGSAHVPIPYADVSWEKTGFDPSPLDRARATWMYDDASFPIHDGTKLTFPSEGTLVRPLDSNYGYSAGIVRVLNIIGDRTRGHAPTVWICADPRNFLKARDVKWPNGVDDILAQYTWRRRGSHDRYLDPDHSGLPEGGALKRDGELWDVPHRYRSCDLEMMMLPDDWRAWGGHAYGQRRPIGITSTASWCLKSDERRSALIKLYVLDGTDAPVPIWGKWDEKSLAEIAPHEVTLNNPAEFHELLGSLRTTVILPPMPRGATGSKWSTAKPYQAFAANTVAFHVGSVDEQGWVIPSKCRGAAPEVAPGLYSLRSDWTSDELMLARWLRLTQPSDLRKALERMDEPTWEWLTRTQRSLLERRWNQHLLEETIERRLGLRA